MLNMKKILTLFKKNPHYLSFLLLILGVFVFGGVAFSQLSSRDTTEEKTEIAQSEVKNEEEDGQVAGAEDENEPTATKSPSPTKSVTKTPTKTPTPTLTPTTNSVSPTSTPEPTNEPTATPVASTPTPTPLPEGTCSINADPSSGDAPLSVQFAYGASYQSSDNYVTAVQWDFDGDGSWDTDMAYAEVNKRPTYEYNSGTHTVRMHLQLVSGYVTDVCTLEITVS